MRFSRFESFSVASSFPTVWIVENTQPNSFLRSQRGIHRGQDSVQNPRVWSARSISPSASMAATSRSSFKQNLPFSSFASLLPDAGSSTKNGISCSDVPWKSSFWLLQPAATQTVGISFAHDQEISEIMLISLSSRDIGSGIDVTSPTPPDCCFIRTWTKMASF